MKQIHPRPAESGFSLIELLVVCSIIAILIGFVVPAASTLLRGSQLTQGSQLFSDQISLARQMALSKNRSIEVRFYKFADPEVPGETVTKPDSGKFRAVQSFEILESGAAVPVSKIQRLPSMVMVSESDKLSTLIKATDASGANSRIKTPTDSDPELPRGVARSYQYAAFRFLPDGSTDLAATGNWFLTMHGTMEKVTSTAETPPANFFTLQIDPVSGVVKSYRPTAG